MCGDNNKDKVHGECVMRNPFTIIIDGVLLLKWVKHNILSVNKLCDKGYSIIFGTWSYLIEHTNSTRLMFNDSRIDNIYLIDL